MNTSQLNSPIQRVIKIWVDLTSPLPMIPDVTERKRAQLLSILSLLTSLLLVAAMLTSPIIISGFSLPAIVTIVSYALSRTYYYKLGSYTFTYLLTMTAFFRIYQGTPDSIEAAINSTVHVALILSSVLTSRRQFIVLVVITTLATFATPLFSNIPPQAGDNIGRSGGIVLTIGAILYGILLFRNSLEKEQNSDMTEANRQLVDIRTSLENNIAERTLEFQQVSQESQRRAGQLQIITDLSRDISVNTSLPTGELLARITHLISEKLGYYHAGIFIMDEKGEYAVLRAANSKGGQEMLVNRHQLKAGGTGIVGYVAQSGRPRIALDTGADAVFFNNPYLPETRSELSLPIKFGSAVIGVLDVQSTQSAAFNEEDTNILMTIANQIGATLQGSGAPTDQRTSRRSKQFEPGAKQIGYSFQLDGTLVPSSIFNENPSVRNAVASGETVTITRSSKDGMPLLAVPVKFRDQVVGIIHIESAETSRNWTEDEILLVQSISDRAALALENARLFENATRRAEQEETISRVTTQIGSSTNFDRIMQTTIQELGLALGASRSFIQIGSSSIPEEGNGSE